jgi:hypothetical protein
MTLSTDCVAFVCNFRYFHKFVETCGSLIDIGEYTGQIVLIIGDDINVQGITKHPFIKAHSNQIIIHYCPDIVFSAETNTKINIVNSKDGKFGHKLFQYHKFHLFTPFFKQWRYVFYIDCGAKIFAPIAPILECAVPNKMLAHSDAYPSNQWKLSGQFRKWFPDIYNTLSAKWNLDVDYFQSTIMLFDTSIIEDDTFQCLCDLTEKYPISGTNDQGILNLYFICVKNNWEHIPIGNTQTYFYDFNIRHNDKPYIMTKYFVFND